MIQFGIIIDDQDGRVHVISDFMVPGYGLRVAGYVLREILIGPEIGQLVTRNAQHATSYSQRLLCFS